jgi:hypothetical protein
MLGHMRHELGHYFELILVSDEAERAAFRALFGDERADYEAAQERHYEQGAPPNWAQEHVSAYATMHPWEDWAETFAHYLHIRDTLQTAAEFGVAVSGPRAAAFDDALKAAPRMVERARSFDAMLESWLPLTYALNALNRSMGHDDLYPFTLAAAVTDKLSYVHERVNAVTGGT